MAETAPTSTPANQGWTLASLLPWAGPACVVGWWVHDLSFHWASLVEYRFGWMAFILAGFLAWERWPSRPAPLRPEDPRPVVAITLLGLAGFAIVLFAELYRIGVMRAPSQVFPLSVGCACFIGAHLLAIGGWPFAKHFLFPLLFFFVAVPLPNLFWQPVVLGLQDLVAVLNVESLEMMGIPAHREGHVIQLPKTRVGVDEACSGIRSLQSTVMAAMFIGDLTLRRWRTRVALLVAGVTLAVIGNWGRSLYLSLTAHRGGSDSLNAVHDSAGWTVLVFTAGGIAVLSWIMSKLDSRLNVRSTPKTR
jgi:exosortase